jgi:gluconolactonase
MKPPLFEPFDASGRVIASESAKLSTVATGFRFLEGPAWHPVEQHLTLSDILGNALYRLYPDGSTGMIRKNSYLANGNTYDRQGRLLTCEHATSRVSRTEANGEITVLAASYKGKSLNSPNDIVVKKDGAIYFTDPASGRSAAYGIPREQELPFQGVYRIDPVSGELTLLVDDFSKPNGLCFSPDESLLFVNDTDRQHIRVFELLPSGLLGEGRLFAELVQDGPGVADGMKFDQAGNLFCSAPRGIQIFDMNARLVARIYTPEVAANFTWGGKELKTLYLAATTSLYALDLDVPGIPLF